MIETKDRDLCDVECPHCGACLDVDDSDDFADHGDMHREDDFEMTCPVCDGSMTVHVTWQPTYPYNATAAMHTTKSEQAREYFSRCGLSYDDITEGDILALVMILNKSIKRAAKAGDCLQTLHLSKKIDIKKKSNGTITSCFLYVNSHYFTRRECISFNEGGFVGFCGWADSRNTAPVLAAFVEWCDYLKGDGPWAN